MKNQFFLSRIVLYSSMLAFAMSPAYADSACDAEVAAIQAELDAPIAGVSAADLEQAVILIGILREDCASGTTFDAVAPISQQLRALLGMGAAS